MCGIIGYIGHAACVPLLLEGLRRLEYRGYDSAGVAFLEDGALQVRRTPGKVAALAAHIASEPRPSIANIGIAHTRWATHGAPTKRNAHPHQYGSVALVHNGIIENHQTLREELIKDGHIFSSDTDTEVAAHLVDRELRAGPYPDGPDTHPLVEATRRACTRIEGAFALLIVSPDFPDVLVATRRASPLVVSMSEDTGESFIASDVPAILPHTRQVQFLEDGDIALVRRADIRIYSDGRTPVHRAPRTLAWQSNSADKNGYRHYMLKEIHEQPDRVLDTLSGRISRDGSSVVLESIEAALTPDVVRELTSVRVLACGTSYHSGLVGRGFIESMAGVPVSVELASEYRSSKPVMAGRELVIAVSQSGETADTLAALNVAKEAGATVISICNVQNSSIPRASSGVIYTCAGPEIGVASTKAFTTQLVGFFLLAVWLGRRRNHLTTRAATAHLAALQTLPRLMRQTIAGRVDYESLARELRHASSALFLGRGHHRGIAKEGALKLKEVSYIHAEGYAAGEIKHGPIALVDVGFPVLTVAVRGDSSYTKMRANIEEVRSRGAMVMAVATENDASIEGAVDFVLPIPAAPIHILPFLTVIPFQLLAYWAAVQRGTDVDQPRNLAKSVTVE